MCVVPCVIGRAGVCVEMMVDTGAQTSVMSASLAQQLDLMSGINRRYQGVASGVGTARILGRLENVACELGKKYGKINVHVLSTRTLLCGATFSSRRPYL